MAKRNLLLSSILFYVAEIETVHKLDTNRKWQRGGWVAWNHHKCVRMGGRWNIYFHEVYLWKGTSFLKSQQKCSGLCPTRRRNLFIEDKNINK